MRTQLMNYLAVAVFGALALSACSSAESSSGQGKPDAGSTSDGGTPDAQSDGSGHGEGCSPKSCLQVGAACGSIDDGCGGTVDCGSCTAPDTCGGAGVENQCGCTVKSCAQLGVNCGEVDTGCGAVDCGECSAPETCGGGGFDNQCGCTCELPHAQTVCGGGDCQIESCDAGWADCDGNHANGCETGIDDDVDNCGACGSSCSFPNSVDSDCQGGTCVLGTCATGFDDCDGQADNGCEANLSADPENCSSCGNVCAGVGGTPVCEFGACGISSCSAGLGDCTSAPGCETNLMTSAAHCGFCGNACSFAHATAHCVQGTCQMLACDNGYGDCDGNAANGCETYTASNVLNCGTCGNACAPQANTSVACVNGSCSYACNPSWVDCDGSPGCEVNTSTDVNNCGSCGASCSGNHVSGGACVGGSCVGDCSGLWADCNNDLRSDGCETDVSDDVDNCGGCGFSCSDEHVALSCSGGVCSGLCEFGWDDCNSNKLFDGCETDILHDPDNCGGCGLWCCDLCKMGTCLGDPCP